MEKNIMIQVYDTGKYVTEEGTDILNLIINIKGEYQKEGKSSINITYGSKMILENLRIDKTYTRLDRVQKLLKENSLDFVGLESIILTAHVEWQLGRKKFETTETLLRELYSHTDLYVEEVEEEE